MARNADQAAESRAGTVPSGPDERPAGGRADGDQARPVHLVFAATPVERAEIDRRLAETGRRGEAIEAGGPDLASRLAGRADDPLLTPVGLAWLPPERGGVRRGSVVDLLTLVNPRRPSVRRQRRILDTDPARSRLVVGAPARLSELRDRFATVTGTSPLDGAFGPFVARQGRLALEREERALAGGRYKVPRLVAEEISQSARFSGAVDELARTLGEPASKVMHQATTALEEMVASHGRLAIDVWDQFTGWMARAYELDVDGTGLGRVRALDRDHALVFLPSHRSYLDPMVLRHALARHGFPPNHTLGGVNVAVWPIGPIARRSGMIFIKRSFRDAPVHKAVLREYIAYLLRKRFNLEWYIEGGRSRTGKLQAAALRPARLRRRCLQGEPGPRALPRARVDRVRPAAGDRQDGGRGSRDSEDARELQLARRLRALAEPSARARPRQLRRAGAPRPDADRGRVGAQGGARGLPPHQQRHADHPDVDRRARAARRRGPGFDLGRGPGDRPADRRLHRATRPAHDRRREGRRCRSVSRARSAA